ncbi:MAG: hypothetical protein CML87_02500 [Rhodobiaceae bacterium]|jgi:hypothetical protein|nr:hypothetical protein [Rhodobiaceae bacterium]|tara:strand:- start:10681 stop:11130 length:450 start_codon:yes stop_codon:yes gene_type:complete
MQVSSTKLQRIVEVPQSYFWKRLVAFKDVGSLLPPPIINKVECNSNDVGSLRHLTLGEKQRFPGKVIERLEAKYADSFFVYSIVDESCLPVKNYIATVTLKGISDTQTDISLSSHWIDRDVAPGEMKLMFDSLYELMFSNAEKQYQKQL